MVDNESFPEEANFMSNYDNHRIRVKTQLIEQDQTGIEEQEEEKFEYVQQSGLLKVSPQKSNGVQSQDECSLADYTTTANTFAVPSVDCVSEDEDADEDETTTDIAEMKPIKDFEWRGLMWPEINPLDLRVTQYGNEIKLRSYRWPPLNNERKGVVFFCHGYDSCQPHLAVIGKHLAQAGYETFAVDMRGHGDSEGERGVFESTEKIYEDYWLLIFEACKKFRINQQRTPIYLFGRSFGGLVATNMANTTIGRRMFAGVVLLTPYYRLFTERLYDAYKWLIPLTMVKPMHKFPTEYEEMDKEYEEKYS